MNPAENAFIERQLEHLFQTDDCTLCGRALPNNVLTSFGLTRGGTAALVASAESLRRLHRKLDRRCARAVEALAAMRDEGAALARRGPDFSVGHLRLDAAAAAIVLACANVVAVNDLLGKAQTWR